MACTIYIDFAEKPEGVAVTVTRESEGNCPNIALQISSMVERLANALIRTKHGRGRAYAAAMDAIDAAARDTGTASPTAAIYIRTTKDALLTDTVYTPPLDETKPEPAQLLALACLQFLEACQKAPNPLQKAQQILQPSTHPHFPILKAIPN